MCFFKYPVPQWVSTLYIFVHDMNILYIYLHIFFLFSTSLYLKKIIKRKKKFIVQKSGTKCYIFYSKIKGVGGIKIFKSTPHPLKLKRTVVFVSTQHHALGKHKNVVLNCYYTKYFAC